MIKAFLFDMDGVLADTEDLSITIGIEYFSSIGIKASRADFEPNLGAGDLRQDGSEPGRSRQLPLFI